MKLILAIGAGSFIGGIFRYLISLLIKKQFPTIIFAGTLSVNMLGCFIIGLIYGFSSKGAISEGWQLFLAVGVLGGFTTFSTFSLETMNLVKSGNSSMAIVYILASVIVGLIATFAGFVVSKLFYAS